MGSKNIAQFHQSRFDHLRCEYARFDPNDASDQRFTRNSRKENPDERIETSFELEENARGATPVVLVRCGGCVRCIALNDDRGFGPNRSSDELRERIRCVYSAHVREGSESVDLGFVLGFHRLRQVIQIDQEDGRSIFENRQPRKDPNRCEQIRNGFDIDFLLALETIDE